MALRIEPNAEPIPGYRLLERLGAGGFGEVWKVEAPGGLLKAIKIVRGDALSENYGDGLANQELKALRRVQSVRHPYLLSIDRYDVIDGHLLIVTELADGSLWDRWLASRRAGEPGLPRDALIRYLSEAAEVLDLMHTKHRLQHLDVKPQNLFLIHDHVKVADFGLVKDLHDIQGVITGGVTPFYAAPETFHDVVSPHCDQYSLAIVYCELLTGHRPFSGGSAQQVMVQHLQVEPNLDRLPESDRAAVARALSKSAADRFPRCADFIQALKASPTTPSTLTSMFEFDDIDHSSGMCETVRRSDETESRAESSPPTAIVIGLGGVGGAVIQRLRAALIERHCDLRKIPLLYVDTDINALTDAQVGDSGLSSEEVFHVPLHRPAQDLSPGHDGPSSVDGRQDTHILNRLARQQTTHGLRALGRLAFADHQRDLARVLAERLRSIAMAAQASKTQCFIVAGLAGGTGGGMYIDVAILAQKLLRRYGGSPDHIQGWLLVPPPSRRSPAEVRATANACAALREIQYLWTASWESHDGNAETGLSSAPCPAMTILPLRSDSEAGQMDGIELAVNGLARELTKRPSDEDQRAQNPQEPREPTFRTFGAVGFYWPRQAILSLAAVRTSQAILGQWLHADFAELRESIQSWFANQWTTLGLGPDHLSRRLQAVTAECLGRRIDAVLEKLNARAPMDAAPPQVVIDWLAEVEAWVGQPATTSTPATAGQFGDALSHAFRNVHEEWRQRITDLATSPIENCGQRLAGAEAATRAAIEAAARMAAHYVPLADQWLRQAASSRQQIDAWLDDPTQRTALIESIRSYASSRIHGLIMGRVAAVYQSVQANLIGVFDRLAVCRQQLDATLCLLTQIDSAQKSTDQLPRSANWLLPAECRSIDDAVDRVVQSLSWDQARALEAKIQESLEAAWGGLLPICSTVSDAPHRLTALLTGVCRQFLTPLIDESGAADAFVGAHGGLDEAMAAIRAAIRTAQPDLGSDANRSDTLILETPPSPTATELAERLAAEGEWSLRTTTGCVDSVVVIRERNGCRLQNLPQLGAAATEAFDLVSRADGAPPYSRVEFADWASAETATR